MLSIVVIAIVIALIFDFLNGMNDAANFIATVVSTKVLPPFVAVLWAAFFYFAAVFFFGVHVANTIGKGIVDPSIVNEFIVLAALVGAVIWVFACTQLGLPISVSHALIGGLNLHTVVQHRQAGPGISCAFLGNHCIVFGHFTGNIDRRLESDQNAWA